MKKLLLLSGVLLFCLSNLIAQQTGMFTQYNESLIEYNPAFTGYRNSINATAFYRMQWAGFEGAPNSQMIAIDTKIKRTEFSLGGVVYLDQAGPLNQKSLSFNASYRAKINRNNYLSFGLKLSGFVYNVSLVDREIVNETDEVYFQDVNTLLQPNTGFGLLYNSSNFFVSLSSPNILKNKLDKGTAVGLENRDNTRNSTHYLMLGYMFDIDNMVSLKTVLLSRASEGAPISAGLNATLIIRDGSGHRRNNRPDKVSIGLNYFVQEQIALFTQLRVKKNYLIGYAASVPASKLLGYSGLTHEIMLNYSLRFTSKGRRRVVSPVKF